MGTIVVTISVVVFLWAVIDVIRPDLGRLPNRASRVGVWIFSVVLFIIGGALMPDDETSSVASTPATDRSVVGQRAAAEVSRSSASAVAASTPRTSFGDGSHEVGVDIAPGTYRTSGPTAGMPICSYARLRTAGASYADTSQVLQLENVMGSAVVTIQSSDGGFFSQLCGTWTRQTQASTPRTSFGDGSHEVGVDIAPGTYRTSGPTAGMPICSYARLRTAGASYADTSQVLQLENVMGSAVVTIQSSDGGFFSQLCGTWTRQTQASTPRTSFGDGSYEVGVDIAPGTYRTSGPTAGMSICSYARLRTAGASYADTSQVLQLENVMGPAVVTIRPSDGGFFSQLCGTWTQR